MARSNEEKERRRAEAQRKAYEFLRGRNGADELSTMLMIVALVLAVISVFTHWIVALLALVAVGVSLWRSFSRDIPARARERQRYLDLIRPLRQRVKLVEMQVKHRDKRYFLCKTCGTVLSVPRGKGKLRVTCPKCHTKSVQQS